jgi:hypothetical protein
MALFLLGCLGELWRGGLISFCGVAIGIEFEVAPLVSAFVRKARGVRATLILEDGWQHAQPLSVSSFLRDMPQPWPIMKQAAA